MGSEKNHRFFINPTGRARTLKQFTTMATKKVTSKREINNVLDNLVEVERSPRYADCAKEYTYTSGTFRCTIDTYGTTLEEQKKMLIHRASCLDRYSIITPAELNRRSNRLQRAMAFIGEHRELIPLLRYCHHLTSGGRRIGFAKMVELYTRTATLPDMVYYQDRDYHIKGVGYRCSSGITHISELIEQVPYIPKAWRCA